LKNLKPQPGYNRMGKMSEDNRSQTILIVDDTPANIRILMETLKSDYKIKTAINGENALKSAVSKNRPDLILLDIMMPGINGFEVCRRLKENPETSDIPIIFITVKSHVEDETRGFELGAADFITKPFSAPVVKARVKTHLSLQTALQEAEKARKVAETSERAKSDFFANMNHELRTPLNSIIGFSGLIAGSKSLEPEHRKNLEIIRRNGEHLLGLINEVLDISRIDAGHISIKEKDTDLHNLMKHLENTMKLQVEKKGLYLKFDIHPGIPRHIKTDEVKLMQVLNNLVGNALKFAKKGGIYVRTRPDNIDYNKEKSRMRLFFEIEDTGPGIESEEQKTLFDPFIQSKSGLESGKGTGLGLSISQKIVQRMGGDLTISSKPGHGSVFRFDIICKLTDWDCRVQSDSPCRVTGIKPGQCRFRILIADDNQDNRELLKNLLHPLKLDIKEAENGTQAVQIWKTWKPHLIWMDIKMPVMNGYEAAKQIRKISEQEILNKVVIIAVTASVFEDDIKNYTEYACDDFLSKPIHEHEVFELMHRHLGLRYTYEENPVTDSQDENNSIQAILESEIISTLPGNILDRLSLAAEKLDMDLIDSVIEEINNINPELADGLRELADDFEYEKIKEIISKGKYE